MFKNPLPTRVTPYGFAWTGRTVCPLGACADWSFVSVYITRVNNLISPFFLGYKCYEKADISTGMLRVCWQKRLEFASFSQRGGPRRGGLPTRVSGRLASYTQRFVSHLELCLLLPSRYLEFLCQRGAQPRTPRQPREAKYIKEMWFGVVSTPEVGADWSQRLDLSAPFHCQSAGHLRV